MAEPAVAGSVFGESLKQSFSAEFVQDAARIFRVEGSDLYIELFADGGTMIFVRTGR